MYHIKSYTSEPHHEHQNYAEHCIGHIKDVTICILIKDVTISAYSPSQVPSIIYGYYVLCMSCTSTTLLPEVVLAIFHLTNLYTVELLYFPQTLFLIL